MLTRFQLFVIATVVAAAACTSRPDEAAQSTDTAQPGAESAQTAAGSVDLPPPMHTPPAVNFAKVIGWTAGKAPAAPDGFRVTRFASELNNPRWLHVLPNGDVLVAESRLAEIKGLPPELEKKVREAGLLGPSANRITLLRDANGDGTPELRQVFLSGLTQPFGMLLLDSTLYVGNTNALVAFPYRTGQSRITASARKILDLPAGGYNNHWTRNVIANADGSKLYVSVGSATNVDEEGIDVKDERRAAILEVNPDGSGMRVFASGLRNPNGLDWAPGTTTLWTVVNERDGLGDDLVPDYLTSVRDGAFYGWPYSYFGQHEDPRQKGKRPDLVASATVPDYSLGAHTASLGLVFYQANAFPEKYRGGAFIGQHGSWNRSALSGYRVAFVPFAAGRPNGPIEDFLGGFIADGGKPEVFGRPVGLAVMKDGSLLVADDAGGVIWRVSATGDMK